MSASLPFAILFLVLPNIGGALCSTTQSLANALFSCIRENLGKVNNIPNFPFLLIPAGCTFSFSRESIGPRGSKAILVSCLFLLSIVGHLLLQPSSFHYVTAMALCNPCIIYGGVSFQRRPIGLRLIPVILLIFTLSLMYSDYSNNIMCAANTP